MKPDVEKKNADIHESSKSAKWWILVAASFVLGRGLFKRKIALPKGVVPRATNQTGHVHKV